jgi:hypothetical protein
MIYSLSSMYFLFSGTSPKPIVIIYQICFQCRPENSNLSSAPPPLKIQGIETALPSTCITFPFHLKFSFQGKQKKGENDEH